jgi:hypothetical protein
VKNGDPHSFMRKQREIETDRSHRSHNSRPHKDVNVNFALFPVENRSVVRLGTSGVHRLKDKLTSSGCAFVQPIKIAAETQVATVVSIRKGGGDW